MVKVLVVDDDRTSRAGLIALMPWEEHGMHVVGEASNGSDALRVLRSTVVDLAFVDIEMPIMSGLDLLRRVRDEDLPTRIVIVSVHQEFELAQEALRGGALDYIVKNDLDEASLGRTLENVLARLGEAQESATWGNWIAIINRDGRDGLDTGVATSLTDVERVSTGFWLGRDVSSTVEATEWSELGYGTVIVREGESMSRSVISTLVKQYVSRHSFYEWKRADRSTSLTVRALRAKVEDPTSHDTEYLSSVASSIAWIYNDTAFDDFCEHISSNRVPPDIVHSLVHQMHHTIQEMLETKSGPFVAPSPESADWEVVRDHLTLTRRSIVTSGFAETNRHSPIGRNLIHAIDIMMHEFASSLTSRDLAARVNMSKSSFDSEFRRRFAMSFHQKLVCIRIDHARELLSRGSAMKIQEVALRCGYVDERHFSLVFRKSVGILPSVFREQHTTTISEE